MRRPAAFWRCLAAIEALKVAEVAGCSPEAIAGAIAAKCKYPWPLDLVEWVEIKIGGGQ